MPLSPDPHWSHWLLGSGHPSQAAWCHGARGSHWPPSRLSSPYAVSQSPPPRPGASCFCCRAGAGIHMVSEDGKRWEARERSQVWQLSQCHCPSWQEGKQEAPMDLGERKGRKNRAVRQQELNPVKGRSFPILSISAMKTKGGVTTLPDAQTAPQAARHLLQGVTTLGLAQKHDCYLQ